MDGLNINHVIQHNYAIIELMINKYNNGGFKNNPNVFRDAVNGCISEINALTPKESNLSFI